MNALVLITAGFIGATIGVIAMALAAAAKDRDDIERSYWRGFRNGARMTDELDAMTDPDWRG